MNKNYKLMPLNFESYKYLKNIKDEYKIFNEQPYMNVFCEVYKNVSTKYEWKDFFENYSKKIGKYKSLVQDHSFLIYSKKDNTVVGMVNTREYLDEFLFFYGGHIGYEIFPKYRNKKILYNVLPTLLKYCKENISDYRVMFCVDEKNIASKKIIKKIGGKMIGTNYDYKTNKNIERYWVYLNNNQ